MTHTTKTFESVRTFAQLVAATDVSTSPQQGRRNSRGGIEVFPTIIVDLDFEDYYTLVLAAGQVEVTAPSRGSFTIGTDVAEALNLVAFDWQEQQLIRELGKAEGYRAAGEPDLDARISFLRAALKHHRYPNEYAAPVIPA